MNKPTYANFALNDVLSVTTGILVSDMDGIYNVLGHMEGRDVWTHELPHLARKHEHAIYAQYPELEGIEIPEEVRASPKDAQEARFFEKLAEKLGVDTLTLRRVE